jgi:cell division GTPase FtsZ
LREFESVLSNSGFALMLVEKLKISESMEEKIQNCFNSLCRCGYKDVSEALIHITGGADFSLQAAEEIIEHIRKKFDVKIITCGASIDKSIEDEIVLTSILTGLNFDRREDDEDIDIFEIDDLLIAKRIPFSIVEEWEEYLKTKFDYSIIKNIISMILASPYIMDGSSLKISDIIRDIELSIKDIDFGMSNDETIKKKMIEIAEENINRFPRLDYFV